MHARVYCFVILVEFWGESEAHVQTNTSGYIMCECLPSAVKHIEASGMYLREREQEMERVREGEREGGRKEEESHTTPIIQPLPPTLYAASSFLLHIHYTYHPAPSSYMYTYTPHCWYTPTHPASPPYTTLIIHPPTLYPASPFYTLPVVRSLYTPHPHTHLP